MEDASLIAIILGNGAVTAIVVGLISHAYSYYQYKSEKDFEARKEAKEYYMTLYSRIGTLDELAKSYRTSLATGGTAKVVSYEQGKIETHASEWILEDFKNAYAAFYGYYLKKASEGYEIFVSKRLKYLLSEFWIQAEIFNNDINKLKDLEEVDKFSKAAEKTTDYMENLFGLKSSILDKLFETKLHIRNRKNTKNN